MAASDLIPDLETAVEAFQSTVDGKQSTIDGKVTSGKTARDGAQTAKDASSTAKDAAQVSLNTAYRNTQSTLAVTGYQDLSEVVASKTEEAVDVFIYDTSKDSDGGAWRHGCTKTSWHNETLNTSTRGSRREFPAVAVIVAESNRVTIYDGDDPSLPMWMVFLAATSYSLRLITYGDDGGITAVAATNGILAVSTTSGTTNQGANGVFRIDFVSDGAIKYCQTQRSTRYDSFLSTRNSSGYNNYLTGVELPRIASNFCNDLAMTVLPDAPIDPAAGLPVPTIAVATDNGVSIIKDSGSVVDINYDTGGGGWNASGVISFFSDGRVAISPDSNSSGNRFIEVWNIPDADISVTNRSYYSNTSFGVSEEYAAVYHPAYGSDLIFSGRDATSSITGYNEKAIGHNKGISFLDRNPDNPSAGMVCVTDITSTSGWMNGDIKGAFLSDTDDTDLVGSGELITNGTFDTDVSGWTAGANGSLSVSSSRLRITNVSGRGDAYTSFATEVGKVYSISLDVPDADNAPSAFWVLIGIAPNNSANFSVFNQPTGSHKYSFVASSATTYLTIYVSNSGAGSYTEFDNISVKLADADSSYKNNPLAVNGTITRAPVATGAELVGYSGFSTSNYLEQPYNSDLDFGTGDFCVMGWAKTNSISTHVLLSKSPASSITPPYFEFQATANGLKWVANAGAQALEFGPWTAGVWRFVCYKRENGVGYAYNNGELNETKADTGNYSHSNSDTLRLGHRQDGYGPFDGSLALWRISATAPSADQIKKIYDDEKALFQENAACTLYGSFIQVRDLAHDPDTGLLHVGTTAARSVFQGLRRVDNTTNAVFTAISASNGMVIDE